MQPGGVGDRWRMRCQRVDCQTSLDTWRMASLSPHRRLPVLRGGASRSTLGSGRTDTFGGDLRSPSTAWHRNAMTVDSCSPERSRANLGCHQSRRRGGA